MADFEEPKAFAFGDLNPVSAGRAAPKFNPKDISVMDAIREVIIGYYKSDTLAGTGPYKGIVLRVEEDMDQNNPAPGNWLSTVFGPQGMFDGLTAPKKLKRYKVRIPEIHVTLPIPSKFAASPQEVGGHQPIIDMYPTFIAHNSNAEQANPGDLVWVDYGHKGNYEDPTFIGPIFPPPDGNAGDGSGGPGNGGPGDAFGRDCGGSLGGGGGGRLASDGRSLITTNASTKWANGMYLHYKDSKARNKKDPAKPIKKMSGYGMSTVKKYVANGGSGKSVSGKIGTNSCGQMQNELAKYLTAQRIACEDQADRGYSFGGKPVDCTVGGIDCSGFVCAVRSVAEFMIGGAENYYGLSDTAKGKNWRRRGLLTRPWYGTLKKYKVTDRYVIDGADKWDWVEIAVLKKANKTSGSSQLNAGHTMDFLNKTNTGSFSHGQGYESGSDIHVPWYDAINNPNGLVQDPGQGIYIMPGDDIIIRPKNPPTWAKSHIKVSHILTTFSDPEGNLRIAESGGRHGGTGSREINEWADAAHKAGFKIFVWQKPEWSKLWAKYGGRPLEPWTPELCRKLAGDEYFSAPEMGKQATGETKPDEQQVSDATKPVEAPPTSTATPVAKKPTPADSTASGDAQTPSSDSAAQADAAKADAAKAEKEKKCKEEYDTLLAAAGGDITAENITKEQALSAAANEFERTEIGQLQAVQTTLTPAMLAETAAGKRKVAQVKAIKDKYEACKGGTAETSASKSQTPPAAPVPAPNCSGGGGGSYTPGAAFSVGADRAGAPLGDVPFVGHLGEIRTNPKMNLVKVPMDKTRQPTNKKHPYYAGSAKVREDVAENMFEMKRILNELGCVMTSSGATRSLRASVGPGRSATSFHYTSLAFDFTLPAMMNNPNVDEHVIEFDPEDNKQFIFWCRSDKTSGSVEKKGVTFEVEHKTLNAIVQKKGSPPGTVPVNGYWVNVTKLMRAHGMERISGRSSWYKNCKGASEAWHFDLRKNAGLVVGKTTFGQVLETVYTPAQIAPHPPAKEAHKTFRGGSFSDIRLKNNISRIGTSPSGIPMYTFTYNNDGAGTVYEGAMAQDILSTHPQAVMLDNSGYYKVDYDMIDVEFKLHEEGETYVI